MRCKQGLILAAVFVSILGSGCGDDDPTSVEMDTIVIRVRYHYWDWSETDVTDQYYFFIVQEGDEFFPEPFSEEYGMFKLIKVIDPLHAEIQYGCPYLAPNTSHSDSCTVVTGLEEVVFSPSDPEQVYNPEITEFFTVRVSFCGY